MQTYEIDHASYWKNEFGSLCNRRRLTEFIVINIENTDFDVNSSRAAIKNKFNLVQVEVARTNDMSQTFLVYTHLGDILNYNDTVLGYDLAGLNLNELEELENTKLKKSIPDVVLVRKSYPKTRAGQQKKKRIWKLKHLPKANPEDIPRIEPEVEEMVDEENEDDEDKPKVKKAKVDKKKKKKRGERGLKDERQKEDYEEFLRDIEEDPEIRAQVNLYKDDEAINEIEKQLQGLMLDEKKETKKEKTDVVKVGGQERKIVKATRKTEKGKQLQEEHNEKKSK
jgi:nonsense-mediated mRNA decay protein 3